MLHGKEQSLPPFKTVELDILYGKGISKNGELLDIGVDKLFKRVALGLVMATPNLDKEEIRSLSYLKITSSSQKRLKTKSETTKSSKSSLRITFFSQLIFKKLIGLFF